MRAFVALAVITFLGGIEISLQAPLRAKENKSKEEATQIALETTGELLPPPKMVAKIKSDLELIRYLDPALSSRIHTGKFKPGQVYIKDISKDQLDELHESEFKPIKEISEDPNEPGKILVVFSKPYNPNYLPKLLKLRFGFDSSPVPVDEERKDQIVYSHQFSTYYWDPANGRNCKKGCFAQYAVSVFVDENDDEDDWSRQTWESNAL